VITERQDCRNKAWHPFVCVPSGPHVQVVERSTWPAHGQTTDVSGTLRALMSEPRITADAVRHVAKLACVSLTADEVVRMQRELDSILGFFAELQAVDVSAVTPTAANAAHAPLRPDEVVPGLDRDELLASAPAHEHGGFAVPKVLDGD